MSDNKDFETVTGVNDGISLIQNKNGLVFGTDALMLSAFVKKNTTCEAVEIGSGTGVISLLLARRQKFKKITAIEVQPYYAELTKRNIERNGFTDIIESVCCDVRNYNGQARVVFTNPPYMKVGNGKRNGDEGKYIARHEVFGDIYDICKAAGKILLYGGNFYCVYRPDRLSELFDGMVSAGIEPKRLTFVHQDTKHEPCLALVEGKKGGKPLLTVTRPLFLCKDGSNEPTDDTVAIYTKGEWID